ncbi:MAG: hypothetical protein CM1200mP39_18420 [Dehalococcoidia bacterium]|nr:MAG: hypothetical protein CM1200mP39_18420 [Dehalococcoidia bacterium]
MPFSTNSRSKSFRLGRHFIAGLMRHAAEICVVTNQWVNSYKRLLPGLEAPLFASGHR